MASASDKEPADRMPTVHEYGQRALADPPTAGPSSAGPSSAAGPSQPTPVSPGQTEATPSARHAEPLSAEQQQQQHQQGRATQPQETQRGAAAATAAATPLSPSDNRVHVEEEPSPIYAWKRHHLLLTLLALILSVVGLGLSGYAASSGAFNFAGPDAILAIPIPIYVLTIVFAIAETAVRAARKFERGLHPAVHVGVWLICWLIYAGLIAAFAILVRWVDEGDDGPYGGDFNERQFITQFVFIILLCLNTFILFITACIDTQAYNVDKAMPPATDQMGNALDPNHHEDRSWRLTKLIFNVLVIVFSIIGFAIGVSMVRFQDRYFSNNIIFPACACALLIPIIWAVAEVCFALTGPRRRFLQGVHPGAHVGMWLISWLILAVIGGILTTFAVYSIGECQDYRDHRDMRRAVAAGDGYFSLPAVPVVDTAIVANRARQVGGVTSTNLLPTLTANPNGNIHTMAPTTSTRVFGSLPTTTTAPFGSDPDDPYGEDPDQDPYEDPYYPYRPSSSSSSSSSRPTSSAYSSDPYDDDPSDYPRGGNSYYNGRYDREMEELCSRPGIDGLMIATCVFMWIVFIFAFVLFVAGCSDTYLRNHLRSPFTVVYVPVGQPVQYQYPPQHPIYSGVPMQGNEKQAMPQGFIHEQPQQPQQPQLQQRPLPAQGNVVEYYGSPQ